MKCLRLYGRRYWTGIEGEEKAFWDAPNSSLWRAARENPRGWYFLTRCYFFRLVLPIVVRLAVSAVVIAVAVYVIGMVALGVAQ